jgi:hypothetical protein
MEKFNGAWGPVFIDLREIVAIESTRILDQKPACSVHLRGGSTVTVLADIDDVHNRAEIARGRERVTQSYGR